MKKTIFLLTLFGTIFACHSSDRREYENDLLFGKDSNKITPSKLKDSHITDATLSSIGLLTSLAMVTMSATAGDKFSASVGTSATAFFGYQIYSHIAGYLKIAAESSD